MAKQVIVMRKDLKMRRGKEIAQGAHASISFLTRYLVPIDFGATKKGVWHKVLLSLKAMQWLSEGFTKVCLQVDSEEELLEIYRAAIKGGLEAHLITDSGKTEFNGIPTHTCCALGPDDDKLIDIVTGHLKLY